MKEESKERVPVSPRNISVNDNQLQFQSLKAKPKVVFNRPLNFEEFNVPSGLSSMMTSPRSKQVPLHKVSATTQINFKIQGGKITKPVISHGQGLVSKPSEGKNEGSI